MKKFMKGCAVTALVLFVTGCVFAAIAGTVRGRKTIENVVENATHGRIHINLSDWERWGISIDDFIGNNEIVEELENIDYKIEEDAGFDRHFSTQTGTIDKYSLGSDIRELDIEVGACSLTTENSSDGNFYLEARNAGKFQGYVKDGVLHINSSVNVPKSIYIKECSIVLYVPEDCSFDKVYINVGAGKLEFDRLVTRSADLEAGAGEIAINQLQAQEVETSVGMGKISLSGLSTNTLDAVVGMGEFTAAGDAASDISIECSMGNVDLNLKGSQQDFNYELSQALGNVTLGSGGGSGFSSEQYIDNHAGKTIDIECSMGNVTITFQQ